MSKKKKTIKKLKKQIKKLKQKNQAQDTIELTEQLNRIETQAKSLSMNLDRLKALLLDNNCYGKNNNNLND